MKEGFHRFVLGLLLIVIAVMATYIAVSRDSFKERELMQKQLQELNLTRESAARQAYSIGYEQAVYDLLSQAADCEQVPVTYGNFTLNLVAAECGKK